MPEASRLSLAEAGSTGSTEPPAPSAETRLLVVTDHAVERPAPLGMAADAPAHREGRDLGHSLHRLDGAMTRLAGKPHLHVPLVREVRESGELVNAHPGNRLLLVPVLVELLDFGIALSRHDLVTPHAARD